MMVLGIMLLAVIVWAVVQVINRRSLETGTPSPSNESAKETLDARLARGEISIEEYKKLRETIAAH